MGGVGASVSGAETPLCEVGFLLLEPKVLRVLQQRHGCPY